MDTDFKSMQNRRSLLQSLTIAGLSTFPGMKSYLHSASDIATQTYLRGAQKSGAKTIDEATLKQLSSSGNFKEAQQLVPILLQTLGVSGLEYAFLEGQNDRLEDMQLMLAEIERLGKAVSAKSQTDVNLSNSRVNQWRFLERYFAASLISIGQGCTVSEILPLSDETIALQNFIRSCKNVSPHSQEELCKQVGTMSKLHEEGRNSTLIFLGCLAALAGVQRHEFKDCVDRCISECGRAAKAYLNENQELKLALPMTKQTNIATLIHDKYQELAETHDLHCKFRSRSSKAYQWLDGKDCELVFWSLRDNMELWYDQTQDPIVKRLLDLLGQQGLAGELDASIIDHPDYGKRNIGYYIKVGDDYYKLSSVNSTWLSNIELEFKPKPGDGGDDDDGSSDKPSPKPGKKRDIKLHDTLPLKAPMVTVA